MPANGICRYLLQAHRLLNASSEGFSNFKPAAFLGCASFSMELKFHENAIAPGTTIHSCDDSSTDRDNQHVCLSHRAQPREHQSASFISSTKLYAGRHHSARAESYGSIWSQSYERDQQEHHWSRTYARNFSTADVIKKLRIPSKQVPNPDELAGLRIWLSGR